jgi:hypothetical protein
MLAPTVQRLAIAANVARTFVLWDGSGVALVSVAVVS